jgi:hypothetical protein
MMKVSLRMTTTDSNGDVSMVRHSYLASRSMATTTDAKNPVATTIRIVPPIMKASSILIR